MGIAMPRPSPSPIPSASPNPNPNLRRRPRRWAARSVRCAARSRRSCRRSCTPREGTAGRHLRSWPHTTRRSLWARATCNRSLQPRLQPLQPRLWVLRPPRRRPASRRGRRAAHPRACRRGRCMSPAGTGRPRSWRRTTRRGRRRRSRWCSLRSARRSCCALRRSQAPSPWRRVRVRVRVRVSVRVRVRIRVRVKVSVRVKVRARLG